MLLRRSEVSRARCCEVRPACCARFDREQRRRSRGSVPCGFTEDGSRAGVALVRDAADVPQGRLPRRRTPRDKRRSHAENDCTSTRKETLIADLQYSASRAGRSAGRSLSWHGRGRGFKSHPVHFIRLVASESRVVCEHQGPRVVRYELEHRSKSEEYEKRPENPKRQLKDPYRISA